MLSVTTTIFAVTLAVPMGVWAAWRSHFHRSFGYDLCGARFLSASVCDRLRANVRVFTRVRLVSCPGLHVYFEGFFFLSLALPTFALGMFYIALIARISRASMLEVLGEDYIRTARAKGASELSTLMQHALKNAAVPIITVIGIGIALLIGGVVVTESVFNIPGLGRLTVDAVLHRDYPIIQGVILVFSATYVVINLLIDLSYTFLDPQIRY